MKKFIRTEKVILIMSFISYCIGLTMLWDLLSVDIAFPMYVIGIMFAMTFWASLFIKVFRL